MYKHWSIEAERYLKNNWNTKTIIEIGDRLKRTDKAVIEKSIELKLPQKV